MSKYIPRVLLVDDEEMVGRLLASALKEYQVDFFSNSKDALIKAGETCYQAALVDLMLPGMNGLEVLAGIKKLQPRCQVIMMTGYGSIPTAVRSIRLGAFDFIEKPFSIANIRRILGRAVDAAGDFLAGKLFEEALSLAGRVGLAGFANREMQELLVTAFKIAGKNINVLIGGETGTGKELLARFIHSASPRSHSLFLPVNCGALAESIMESELFGHEKGAFTGANRRHRGCFELADGGTLFLDEVGDASPGLQTRFLRVLETGEFQRVGGEDLIHVDVRVVAATNIDLEKAVQKKIFREDLYYRLGTVRLNIPPLRRRPEDILTLAEHFLYRISMHESGYIPVLSPEVRDVLIKYNWPGNVRELANSIQHAAILATGGVILPEHLPEQILHRERQHFDFQFISPSDTTPPPSLMELEKLAVIAALRYCRGNIKAAASVLGVGRATMHRKIKVYGIDVTRACESN